MVFSEDQEFLSLLPVEMISGSGLRSSHPVWCATPVNAMPEANSSLVSPAYYCCWWSYGVKKCSYYCGGKKYYKPYYRPYYKPYYKYKY